MKTAALALVLTGAAHSQPLPGTAPLTFAGDPAAAMVEGIARHMKRVIDDSPRHRKPTRERLRYVLGVVDPRVSSAAPETIAALGASGVVYEDAEVRVTAVRWPALDGMTADGLHLLPKRGVKARVVVLPDAGQTPEQSPAAWRLARSGCEVLVPFLIDRDDTYSGNPKFRMTSQPHREYVWRMAYLVGRHILGYEAQKALAAVDWFARQPEHLPVGVWGYGEGGWVALAAAALDERIAAAGVSGSFVSRRNPWQEPIDRTVWGGLSDFGDAEIASLARAVLVDLTPGPTWAGPKTGDPKRRGGAPGRVEPPPSVASRAEADRARALGAKIEVHDDATAAFLRALGVAPVAPAAGPPMIAPRERILPQLTEMLEFTQRLVRQSEFVREDYWKATDREVIRKRFAEDVIGRLPKPYLPANARTRLVYHGAKWDGYEVMLDVLPGVFAYGVLLLPKNLQAGERRPVVVCQHGLNGRPQSMFGVEAEKAIAEPDGFRYYQNIGSKLADDGLIVYLPQNPYIGDFRDLNRIGNPVRLSMFSYIVAQHDRLTEWLAGLPQVDAHRIGFYGLSYGGKTALRVPALVDRYALSICSGDFNEWIVKLTTTDEVWTYMFTHEYEIDEFNLASIANHAEMALLIAPRPFMVERGHRDGVGDDKWIAYEYAKVKRAYDEAGFGDRTSIEYFNGPHRINGVGTVEFLKKHLRWPR